MSFANNENAMRNNNKIEQENKILNDKLGELEEVKFESNKNQLIIP